MSETSRRRLILINTGPGKDKTIGSLRNRRARRRQRYAGSDPLVPQEILTLWRDRRDRSSWQNPWHPIRTSHRHPPDGPRLRQG